MSDEQLELLQAYARLKGLRANAPSGHVYMNFINEYHSILDRLAAASGVDLGSFRIPREQLHDANAPKRAPGATYAVFVGQEKLYCPRDFFLVKVDGVLIMFEFLTSSTGKARIGFAPTRKGKSTPQE